MTNIRNEGVGITKDPGTNVWRICAVCSLTVGGINFS